MALKPPLRSAKVLDYEDMRAYFETKYRFKDDSALWEFVTKHAPEGANHVVVNVENALLRGDEVVANFAGCLQKEYKEPYLVLDLTKRRRVLEKKA